jgi:ribosomal protein S12 methylthiotransferase
MQVLVEGPSAESELVWEARLPTQAPDIDGVCYISEPGERELRSGEFRTMRIVKAHDYDLTGDLLDDPHDKNDKRDEILDEQHSVRGRASPRETLIQLV